MPALDMNVGWVGIASEAPNCPCPAGCGARTVEETSMLGAD